VKVQSSEEISEESKSAEFVAKVLQATSVVLSKVVTHTPKVDEAREMAVKAKADESECPLALAVRKLEPSTCDEESKSDDSKHSYEKVLGPMQFDEVSTFPMHHFLHNKHGTPAMLKTNVTLTRQFVRRVASEYNDLSSGVLPLHPESSVFVRVHETDMRMLQMLISAPMDTPYGGGLFLFDVELPEQVCSHAVS